MYCISANENIISYKVHFICFKFEVYLENRNIFYNKLVFLTSYEIKSASPSVACLAKSKLGLNLRFCESPKFMGINLSMSHPQKGINIDTVEVSSGENCRCLSVSLVIYISLFLL